MVEVSRVCRNYCSQVWYEALNQAGVEASSILRKGKNVYYPLAIRAPVPPGSRTNTASEVAKVGKDSAIHVPTFFDNPSGEAEQSGATKKENNANQGVVPDAMKPPIVTQDPPAEKETPKTMEIFLASLPLPIKVDLTSKGTEASEAASISTGKVPPKENL